MSQMIGRDSMSNLISRRNWLKLVGGSAVGLMLTPVPWRLLGDSAKWTQSPNYPGSALGRKPVWAGKQVSFKYTTCTICPMACGIRVKCVEGRPVSLGGTPHHPMGEGALCEMGLGAHLLPFHPSRLLQPYKRLASGDQVRTLPYSFDKTVGEIDHIIAGAKDSGEGSIAVLDARPDRSISYVYRQFVAGLPNGVYINPPGTDEITESVLRNSLKSEDSYGVDVGNVRTILSFGTPVLSDWGTLSQAARIAEMRTAPGDGRLKVIQVESAHSRTAGLADEWIAVKPGTEAALALALANVMVTHNLCDIQKIRKGSVDFQSSNGRSFVQLISEFSPVGVAERTGIASDNIVRIAKEIASRTPSLVLSGGNPGTGSFSAEEQTIFMDLNFLLGAVDSKGGLNRRDAIPGPLGSDAECSESVELADVPDNSIKVLIMDGADSVNAIPWSLIERKLVRSNPTVISFSPFLIGPARHADFIIPSPASIESYSDSPTPQSSSMPSYSISAPLIRAPAKTVEPLEVIKKIAMLAGSRNCKSLSSLTTAELIRKRTEKILMGGNGFVFDASSGGSMRISSVSSPDHLLNLLYGGGCWHGGNSSGRRTREVSFLGGPGEDYEKLRAAAMKLPADDGLVLVPFGGRGAGSSGQIHPEMTKLYRESTLREPANVATVNPMTGKRLNLNENRKTILQTEVGSIEVNLKFDAAVRPDIVEVTVGPFIDSFERAETLGEKSVLDICKIESDSTWRTTRVRLLQA